MSNEVEKRRCDAFFKSQERLGLALSYGDVRLKTRYSEVLPSLINLETKFSRNVFLKIPIISSPMDTVTEYKMAIAMAELGGLGVIHKGLSPKEQASQVAKVKHRLSAFISEPICVLGSKSVGEVLKLREEKDYKFFTFPVKNESGNIIGLVGRDDFKYCRDLNKTITEIMTTEMITAGEEIGVEEAYLKMSECRKGVLPIFDSNGLFKGIYTYADTERIVKNNHQDYNLDVNGNFRVGAAIGVGDDTRERMELLSKQNVDVVIIDTAHGDSKSVIEAVKFCKKNYSHIDVVAGNISEASSAKNLAKAGVDGIRVGQGPGSICTTRIIAGVGCPQVTAVYNCSRALRGSGIPVCADGGIEYSGDISIALGAGADNVMLGKVLAGTEESPGIILYYGDVRKKLYRGMGSLSAMKEFKASRDRYNQPTNGEKLVPEGIEGEVDYKGKVEGIIIQYLGGLKSGMGYLGAKNISAFQGRSDFYRISNSGLRESHPHGIDRIQDAPNYRS